MNPHDYVYPRVGIGVMVSKDGNVLMGKRIGSHGEGEYQFPGGHLEFGESFEQCARREVKEETGMQINNIRFQFLANLKKYTGKHYVHIGFTADWEKGNPQDLEPERCEGWSWYPLDNLPEPLFDFSRLSFDSLKTKQTYYDS